VIGCDDDVKESAKVMMQIAAMATANEDGCRRSLESKRGNKQ
jgi:hypothetical protein